MIPMLVVPFAHDQPDNAERLRRLGVARIVLPDVATSPNPSCLTHLRQLLANPSYSRKA